MSKHLRKVRKLLTGFEEKAEKEPELKMTILKGRQPGLQTAARQHFLGEGQLMVRTEPSLQEPPTARSSDEWVDAIRALSGFGSSASQIAQALSSGGFRQMASLGELPQIRLDPAEVSLRSADFSRLEGRIRSGADFGLAHGRTSGLVPSEGHPHAATFEAVIGEEARREGWNAAAPRNIVPQGLSENGMRQFLEVLGARVPLDHAAVRCLFFGFMQTRCMIIVATPQDGRPGGVLVYTRIPYNERAVTWEHHEALNATEMCAAAFALYDRISATPISQALAATFGGRWL